MSVLLSSKWQITIPKKLRDHLEINPGDRLAFKIGGDGRVSVAKVGYAGRASRAKGKMTTDQIMALLRGEA